MKNYIAIGLLVCLAAVWVSTEGGRDEAHLPPPAEEVTPPSNPLPVVHTNNPALMPSTVRPLVWHTDLDAAEKLATESGKGLLLIFCGAPGTCPKCMKLEKMVRPNLDIAEACQDDLVVALLDGSQYSKWGDTLHIVEYPVGCFYFPEQSLVLRFDPPLDPDAFVRKVRQALEERDKYESLTIDRVHFAAAIRGGSMSQLLASTLGSFLRQQQWWDIPPDPGGFAVTAAGSTQ